MQPATNPVRPAEDLHSILNRFQTWAGKQPENHNGHKQNPEGVREIPMEEAMRQLRGRRATSTSRALEKPRVTPPPALATAVETKTEVVPKPAPANQAAVPPAKTTEIPGSEVAAQPTPTKRTVDRKAHALSPMGATAARLAATARRKPAVRKPEAMAKPAAAPVKRPVPKRDAIQRAPAQISRATATMRAQFAMTVKSKKRTARKAAKPSRPATREPERRKAQANGKPEFREVLARSVRAKKQEKRQERRQRVSVRLSREEERRLQQRATQAGLTISEYLRQSALTVETPRSETMRARTDIRTRTSRPATATPLFAASSTQNSSMLGGWIALLRNRFLALPARMAERA